jgi:hypothetical protein
LIEIDLSWLHGPIVHVRGVRVLDSVLPFGSSAYSENTNASAEGVDTITPVPEDCTSPLMA